MHPQESQYIFVNTDKMANHHKKMTKFRFSPNGAFSFNCFKTIQAVFSIYTGNLASFIVHTNCPTSFIDKMARAKESCVMNNATNLS